MCSKMCVISQLQMVPVSIHVRDTPKCRGLKSVDTIFHHQSNLLRRLAHFTAWITKNTYADKDNLYTKHYWAPSRITDEHVHNIRSKSWITYLPTYWSVIPTVVIIVAVLISSSRSARNVIAISLNLKKNVNKIECTLNRRIQQKELYKTC
jgi:hypothetical protein